VLQQLLRHVLAQRKGQLAAADARLQPFALGAAAGLQHRPLQHHLHLERAHVVALCCRRGLAQQRDADGEGRIRRFLGRSPLQRQRVAVRPPELGQLGLRACLSA
jgi:hypothetical protein